MGSPKLSWNGKDTKTSMLVFLGGLAVVALQYTGEFLGGVDFGPLSQVVTAIMPAVITGAIRYVRDNTPTK